LHFFVSFFLSPRTINLYLFITFLEILNAFQLTALVTFSSYFLFLGYDPKLFFGFNFWRTFLVSFTNSFPFLVLSSPTIRINIRLEFYYHLTRAPEKVTITLATNHQRLETIRRRFHVKESPSFASRLVWK